MLRAPIRCILLFLAVSACTPMCQKRHEDMSSEEVLKKYLDIAFNMNNLNQKDELLNYTTGELKSALAGADSETIKAAYLDKKFQLLSFAIVQREDFTPRESKITYLLKFRETTTNPPDFSQAPLITNENTVTMIREDNKWLINQVVGSESTFDFPLMDDGKIKNP